LPTAPPKELTGSAKPGGSARLSLELGAAVLAGAGMVGGLLGAVMGSYRFRLARGQVALAGLRAPLRLALLSDLHLGPFIRRRSLARWVDATLRLQPELILLGGDMIDHWATDLEPLLEELSRLHAPLGVYAVWGNHDHAVLRGRRAPPGMAAFARALEERAGVTVLRNASCRPRDDLYLAGIDDLQAGRPDLAAALAGTSAALPPAPAGRHDLPAAPAGTAADRRPPPATVLLSHNPDILPDVPTSVGLTLAGHTHGGQVCLPGYGAIYTGSAHGRRFASGWVRAPALGYVSRGLGVSGAPLRFACPAEITVLELVPADRGGAAARASRRRVARGRAAAAP